MPLYQRSLHSSDMWKRSESNWTAVVAGGCARAVDEAQVSTDLQARLDRDLKPGLFTLAGLRREGSAPMPASESDRKASSRLPLYILYRSLIVSRRGRVLQ